METFVRMKATNPCYATGTFQPVPASQFLDSTHFGPAGSLLTHNSEDLINWCITQPAPKQDSLRLFVAVLGLFPNRTTAYRQRTSYGLKHDAEHLGERMGEREYISNEDLIIAMVQAHFRPTQARPSGCIPGPNYYFNVSKRALDFVRKTHPLKLQEMVFLRYDI